MAVTLKQVAERLNLSPATVSVALHPEKARKVGLSPTTVEQIKKVAHEMGYQPNSLAASLRTSRTHMIGVLVPKLLGDFYEGILLGIHKVMYPEFMPVLAVTNYDPVCERAQLEAFWGKRLDGVIAAFSGVQDNAVHYKDLAQNRKMPLVLIDRAIEGLDLPIARTDHFGFTHKAVVSLAELGHKKIMYSAYYHKIQSVELREQGYRQGMADAGLRANTRVLNRPHGSDLKEFAKQIVSEAIENKCTAILLGNDTIAFEVLGVCEQRSIKVPENISVMGIGNSVPAGLAGINLSSVSQDPQVVGEKAGQLLLQVLEGKTPEPREIILPCDIVLRKTTGRI